jgi:hypothetical protein
VLEKKKNLIKLVIISAFIATLIIPVANAEIKISDVQMPDVVASNPPTYGEIRFNLVVTKNTNQTESLNIPVLINGTTLSIINVAMRANEVSKVVQANVTVPGSTILMINPFIKAKPIPSNITYAVSQNPYANPISSLQYVIKVGDFEKNVSVLVYANWTIWAIIIDVIAIIGIFLFIRRLSRG